MIYQYRRVPLPYEGNLVIALSDSSVRIWERKINQPVGNRSLRDDMLFALVMSGDRTNGVSVDFGKKVFVWSLDGA
ncbi:hypothetical protein M405DRAFT_636838 [Rhizopogon salebrosus TDB-379]|nr:hypothetical protein M405DRAFT_636838 [Rhizopogon salebrosus TDB-379]